MTLKELREKLKADRTKLNDLRSKAAAEGATPEDRKAYKDAITECEKTLDLIKDAEKEEALDAESSKAADAPVGGEGEERRVHAQPEVKLTADQRIGMCAAASAKSALILKMNGQHVPPLKLLADEGFPAFAKQMEQAARAKAAVTSGQDSAVLLPQPVAGDILPFLRPETTFLQGNPRRVRLVGGKYRQPRGASSATANYIGEGEKKPVGRPTFDDINMQAKKLAGIVMLTNEAAKWPVADIEAYIRDDLRRVIALKMDSAMYFGTGTGSTPLGILNRTGITIIDATATGTFTDPLAPTIAEIDRIATRMILALTGSNIPRSRTWRWTMGYRAFSYLADLRDGNGNALFPTLNADAPTWKGIPVLVSNQFTENGGTNTDEGTIGLVDFAYVLFGDEEDFIIKSSTEATIDDGGTLVLLWQQNMMAILAEIEHDVALGQAKAVAKLTGVRWGALAPAA